MIIFRFLVGAMLNEYKKKILIYLPLPLILGFVVESISKHAG